ncbi:ABC superfamily ATP binding cassette transporter, binding protein [Meiothermus ruber H328]|nr:ABC superfamily ATP binding cassette transporter, binding protein [Meiothermus ruber H328]
MPEHLWVVLLPEPDQPHPQPGCLCALLFGQAALKGSGIACCNFRAQHIGHSLHAQVGWEGLLQALGANLGSERKGQGIGHNSLQDNGCGEGPYTRRRD